jgi:hypothetical protein
VTDAPRLPGDDGSSLVPGGGGGAPLLRVRDVKALNRAFHQLAEVQEGLLDRLEAMEEERSRRQRMWLPLAGAAALVLVGALAVLAWVVAHQPSAAELQAALEAGRAEIVVEPPPVTVQAPESAVDAATLEALIRQLEASRVSEEASRRTIAELSERLLEREEASLEALRNLGRLAPAGEGAAAPGAGPAPAEAAAEAAPVLSGLRDPWLGALNGLLAVSGFSRFQFDQGTRVRGEPLLREVTLVEWDTEGRVASIYRAEEARFALHQMTGLLVVELLRGNRHHGGANTPLGEEGTRLEFAGIDPRPWAEHFPELRTPLASEPGRVLRVREALDALLAVRRPMGYYRLAELGGLDGSTLKLVQLQRFDGAGRLVRALEADSLEVRLHPSGEVELLLLNGAIQEGGVRRPFYEDRFRVFLPRQPLEAWRSAGVPLTELPG